ncbi:MAG: nucleotide sugar dehydrogenase [Clostridiales bacterium]|nr:nucleotide sugar dehydrogenase [Clostridiales bacterium]
MKKIAILGLGYIGLPTAITLADAGFVVAGFDTNQEIVNILNTGRIHIVEPGLGEALNRSVSSGRLTFSNELTGADVFYIAVPTPFYSEMGRISADLSYVKSAASMIAKVIKEGNLVILESTVPPRTTEMISKIIEEESGLREQDFCIAHCPERVIPGHMLEELKNNDRIVGGRTKKAGEMAKEIYEKVLVKGKIRLTDDLTAEMCKLTENTFRDINIAFANELSIICDELGIDVFELISLANCHPRVNILNPGVGVGGHCIAVDPWFIYEQFPEEAKLIYAARLRNDSKPKYVADCVFNAVKDKKDAVIAVLGLSYKPDVDDLRESPSIELCHELTQLGCKVIACEPFVDSDVNGILNLPLEEAIRRCDYSVITLKHTVFSENKDLIASKPYYDCVGLMK